jgi:trk system potassium uptake protein TrkA
MRFVFVGAGRLTVMIAKLLVSRGHEVVIVEQEKNIISALGGEIDCAFLHGDGSKPPILREVGPDHTDVLFALTNDDKANVLAALIGRSLDFKKVVPSIRDPELMSICGEPGLEDGR